MRLRLASGLIIAVAAVAAMAVPAVAACTNASGMLRLYQGAIGKDPVRATLAFSGAVVRGQISAGRGFADVLVSGTQSGDMLMLDALTPRIPALLGTIARCSVIQGTWRNPFNGRVQTIQLRGDSETGGTLAHRYDAAGALNDSVVDAQVRAFRSAVMAQNERAVVGLVAYPLRVNHGSQARLIANSAQFLAEYHRIITPAVRSAIARAVPADLFARDQGVMLGSGVTWFDERGKAISINQP